MRDELENLHGSTLASPYGNSLRFNSIAALVKNTEYTNNNYFNSLASSSEE